MGGGFRLRSSRVSTGNGFDLNAKVCFIVKQNIINEELNSLDSTT